MVDLIDVYLISPDKKVKDDKKPILERFQCKNYKLGGTDLPQQTKNCVTGPYHYEKIEKAVFTIGKSILLVQNFITRCTSYKKSADVVFSYSTVAAPIKRWLFIKL